MCVFSFYRCGTIGEWGNYGAFSRGSRPFGVVKDVARGGATDYQVRIRVGVRIVSLVIVGSFVKRLSDAFSILTFVVLSATVELVAI